MFGRRYFGGRYFAPRYWGAGSSVILITVSLIRAVDYSMTKPSLARESMQLPVLDSESLVLTNLSSETLVAAD